MQEPLIQWDEPIYVSGTDSRGRATIVEADYEDARSTWSKALLRGPKWEFFGFSAFVVVAAFVLAVEHGDFSRAPLVVASGIAYIGLRVALQYSDRISAAVRGPGVVPTTVAMTGEAILVASERGAVFEWRYDALRSSRVGMAPSGVGARPVLRVQFEDGSWEEVNVAPTVSLDRIASLLREHGVPVSRKVKHPVVR